MGTLLAVKGWNPPLPEEMDLGSPEIAEPIHGSYLAAGARVLDVNGGPSHHRPGSGHEGPTGIWGPPSSRRPVGRHPLLPSPGSHPHRLGLSGGTGHRRTGVTVFTRGKSTDLGLFGKRGPPLRRASDEVPDKIRGWGKFSDLFGKGPEDSRGKAPKVHPA